MPSKSVLPSRGKGLNATPCLQGAKKVLHWVCVSTTGRNTPSRMEAQLVTGDLTLVFLSLTIGKRPQHGGAQLLAVSLWGAPCFFARGHRNLENQDGGSWFITNPQRWNLKERSCQHLHWRQKVTLSPVVFRFLAGPELGDVRKSSVKTSSCAWTVP